MKTILLFGAGKSSTVLIDYLKDLSLKNNYNVVVADANFESLHSKVGEHPFVKAIQADAEKDTERHYLIKNADVVISLLPQKLQYLVAADCLELGKHLLTASYVDDKLQVLKQQIKDKNLLFLFEMGLDPGIDHMSAMNLITRIKTLGGTIKSFKSHCGGLVAPESNNNPWHYKITWNPRNIVLAGKGGAAYKVNNEEKHLSYGEVFMSGDIVEVGESLLFSYYPNRNSLKYIPTYSLPEAHTFIRTTLRHADFCFGWKNLIDLKLTDDTVEYDTDGLSIADFFKEHFNRFGFNKWLNEMIATRLSFAKDIMENLVQLIEAENDLEPEEKIEESIMLVNEEGELNTLEVENVKDKAAATLAVKMHEASLILKQLLFLGLDSDELINRGILTAAEILQLILEEKLALHDNEKDMVVMLHEIEYEANGLSNVIKSSLIIKGEDNKKTAMAKTVGLPLGIAAKLILEGKLTTTGLNIPIVPCIYEPILAELEHFGICFEERLY